MSPRTLLSRVAPALLASGCVFISDEAFDDRLDADGDGFVSAQFGGDDCDDADAAVYPGAAEVCDAVDADCDGELDDGEGAAPWYPDGDGDGFGDATADPVVACVSPEGHVESSADCDDTDAAINPDAAEVCDDDGVDEDCNPATEAPPTNWYTDGDGDGYGDVGASPVVACSQPSGAVDNADDCDDTTSAINPGEDEVCDNGVDDDCDPTTSCAPSGSVDVASSSVLYFGQWTNGVLGRGLATGDIDDDGVIEMLMGENEDVSTSGRIYIVDPDPEEPEQAVAGVSDAVVVSSDRDPFVRTTGFGWALELGPVDTADTIGLFVGAPQFQHLDLEYGCGGGVFALEAPTANTSLQQLSEVVYLVGTGGGRLGEAVASGDDVDGDGIADLLLGAPGFDPGDPVGGGDCNSDQAGDGGAFVVANQGITPRSGEPEDVAFPLHEMAADGDALQIDAGTGAPLGAEAEVGFAVAWVGDLNGDGASDVAAGAPGAIPEDATDAVGAVIVHEAVIGGLLAAQDADLLLFGVEANSQLGAAVARVVDVDGDGFDDLVLGAPGKEGAPGAVEVVFGSSTALTGVLTLDSAGVTRTTIAGSGSDRAGRAVASSPDLDGDDTVELLVGATGVDSDSGAVWSFSGLERDATLTAADAAFVLTNPDSGALFGGRISAPGDLDGDVNGTPDLVIGAPARSEGGSTFAGGVWWFTTPGL